jgi:hypothetical protein
MYLCTARRYFDYTMTVEDARRIEGLFGRIEGFGERRNYPLSLYGKITIVDSYWLLFETTENELVMFSLRKVSNFSPRRRMFYIKKKLSLCKQ